MLWWSLAGASALLYWGLSLREGTSWPRSGIKGLAVMPLALAALGEGSALVALALALCSLGDILLSRPGERAFLAGLVAFALGHLGWIAVFVVDLGLSLAALGQPLQLGLILGLLLLSGTMAWLILPRAGALRVPVTVYILVICAMGLGALATDTPLILAGAALFALSDALLGLQTFVLARGVPAERVANALIWPLYWGAIALLSIATLTG